MKRVPGTTQSRRRAALVALLMLCGAGLGWTAGPSGAQDMMRIAAIVNDTVISVFDLETRINMAMTSSNLQNSDEVRRRLAGPVLRNLIDEALQVQEAERQGVRVTDQDIARALAQIESNNGLQAGGLPAYLAPLGIAMSTVETQVMSQIAWGKYINQRIRPTIDISEDEIDEEMARIEANRGRPEYMVSQISLYFDAQTSEADVMATARSLVEQIRNGANFAAVAAQFSQGSMARNGGDLGWIHEGESRPQFDEALATMAVSEVSDPIKLLDGVHILALRDKRTGANGDSGEIQIYLTQILLPSEPDEPAGAVATRLQTAQGVADGVTGCEAFNQKGSEVEGSLSGDIGWVRLTDLPSEFRDIVAGLEIGTPGDPISTATGVHVLMVCDRRDPSTETNMRDVIYEQIATRRLAILERQLIRDLRRAAFVDLRV
jgi:peptidyl-prolyl cis-trans isomerase SurA